MACDPDQVQVAARLSSESLSTLLALYPEDHPAVVKASIALADLLEAADL
jgi:hypothetical protein